MHLFVGIHPDWAHLWRRESLAKIDAQTMGRIQRVLEVLINIHGQDHLMTILISFLHIITIVFARKIKFPRTIRVHWRPGEHRITPYCINLTFNFAKYNNTQNAYFQIRTYTLNFGKPILIKMSIDEPDFNAWLNFLFLLSVSCGGAAAPAAPVGLKGADILCCASSTLGSRNPWDTWWDSANWS